MDANVKSVWTLLYFIVRHTILKGKLSTNSDITSECRWRLAEVPLEKNEEW